MAVSPNGQMLVVAMISGGLEVFSISSGMLAEPPVSFPDTSSCGWPGLSGFDLTCGPAGVDINSGSDLVFAGLPAIFSEFLQVFDLADNGTLTQIANSPYNPPDFTVGSDANVVRLSPNNQFLFASNDRSGSVSVYSVDDSGNLTLVAGSPFATGSGNPAGMDTDTPGRFLYVASSGLNFNFPGQVSVFAIGSDGGLSLVSGLPFTTHLNGSLEALAAFPSSRGPSVSGSNFVYTNDDHYLAGVLSTSDAEYQPAYETNTGWDFATGIGTVNASNLVMAALPGMTPAPTPTPTPTPTPGPTPAGGVYDAAAEFEQGWTTQSNPNGAWSYGYSSGFTVLLRSMIKPRQTASMGQTHRPGSHRRLTLADHLRRSSITDQPMMNGNVDFLANEFVLVAGIGGQYSDLVFTAPADGMYSVVEQFSG